MEIWIADVSLDDLDRFYEIEQQCFNNEAFSRQQIACMLVDPNAIGLVARLNGETAGFIIGKIDTEKNSQFGHILTIDVLPIFRRRGIARRLLKEIERILWTKGIKECRLEVREDNIAALNLYHKQGYATIRKLKRYYGIRHGLYLKKEL